MCVLRSNDRVTKLMARPDEEGERSSCASSDRIQFDRLCYEGRSIVWIAGDRKVKQAQLPLLYVPFPLLSPI